MSDPLAEAIVTALLSAADPRITQINVKAADDPASARVIVTFADGSQAYVMDTGRF